MFCLNRLSLSRHLPIATAAVAFLLASLASAPDSWAQQPGPDSSSSSSSSSSNPGAGRVDTTPRPRIAQAEAGGSAIMLETSAPLFYLATALNTCGYDAGLAASSSIRAKVRGEINEQLAASAPARDARDAMCTFIRLHALADPGRDIAQYVSLSLYVNEPPALTPTVDITELPPDSTQVVELLPLLRSFADAVHLNALWGEHRAEYEGFVDRIHDPLTRMVLDTNVYLRLPVAGYEGRRFLVLLEPMLSPGETNARIYGDDFIVVVSPAAQPPDAVRMDLVRHIYLQFLIEPMVYSRSSSMDRLLPLLKPVQQAPVEFIYKSDIAALLTECMIRAVEAHTMDVGIPPPAKPREFKDRSEEDKYEEAISVYDRQAEAVRRKTVDLDMRQGWVMVDYFYSQLGLMEKEGSSLKDKMGQIVYGMDVERQVHQAQQIAFLPEGSGEGGLIHHTPPPLSGLDLAEMKLMKGDLDGAGDLADTALKANPANPEAHYLLGRIDLIEGDAEGALDHLTRTVSLSHDPRTVAWAHIYLGRLYDVARDPDNPDAVLPQRQKAIAEYKAALANRDSRQDTKDAAEKGIQSPFTLPRRAPTTPDGADDSTLDPTGKAAKESYRPTAPQ